MEVELSNIGIGPTPPSDGPIRKRGPQSSELEGNESATKQGEWRKTLCWHHHGFESDVDLFPLACNAMLTVLFFATMPGSYGNRRGAEEYSPSPAHSSRRIANDSSIIEGMNSATPRSLCPRSMQMRGTSGVLPPLCPDGTGLPHIPTQSYGMGRARGLAGRHHTDASDSRFLVLVSRQLSNEAPQRNKVENKRFIQLNSSALHMDTSRHGVIFAYHQTQFFLRIATWTIQQLQLLKNHWCMLEQSPRTKSGTRRKNIFWKREAFYMNFHPTVVFVSHIANTSTQRGVTYMDEMAFFSSIVIIPFWVSPYL
jgi:hypothetical protein